MIQSELPEPDVPVHAELLWPSAISCPRAPGKTELHWYYIGYEDDTPEQEEMRINQGNLTGAAGYVSLEDGCINEFVQRGSHGSEGAAGVPGNGRQDRRKL